MATQEEDRKYHTQRAREELDRAYRADRQEAASSHMRLSSLHMSRAKIGAEGSARADQPSRAIS